MKKIKKKDLKDIVKNKKELQNINLIGENFSGMDLSERNFSSLDLSSASFKRSLLKKTDLSHSTLTKTNFFKANLNEANLREVDCSNSDFSLANMSSADLTQAKLSNMVVYKTNMQNVILNSATFKNTNLSHINLSNCKAREADFSGINLNSSDLSGSNVEGVNFREANLSNILAKETKFSGCCLVNANLEGAILDGADFSGADLTNANLCLTSLSKTTFNDATLKNTNFRYAWGLTPEKKENLTRYGATVSHIWSNIQKSVTFLLGSWWRITCLLILFIAIAVYFYVYFSDINHMSISRLQKKWKDAKLNKQQETVLQVDLVLIEKYKKRGNPDKALGKSLDAARTTRLLGDKKKSLEMLEVLQEEYAKNPSHKVKIKTELALYYERTGNVNSALSILEETRLLDLKKENLYSVEMMLAEIYRKKGRLNEAEIIYKKNIINFRNDIFRYSRSLLNLSKVYEAKGEIKKAIKIISPFAGDGIKKLEHHPQLKRKMKDQMKNLNKKSDKQ